MCELTGRSYLSNSCEEIGTSPLKQEVLSQEVLCDLPWYVAHVKPRREKRLAAFCKREHLFVTLPCVKSVKLYGRKKVEFEKPLFPGYVFFRSEPAHAQMVRQNEHAANLLTIYDQNAFQRQLGDILTALESGSVVAGAPDFSVGREVRISSGPLAGMSGRVIRHSDPALVMLRLDFIAQGAVVVVERSILEIID